MEKSELWKRWKVTFAHLKHARQKLAEPTVENQAEYQRLLSDYHDYLEHDELELALDCLEELGDLTNSRGSFWQDLERAARTMQLTSRVLHFHQKFLAALRSIP